MHTLDSQLELQRVLPLCRALGLRGAVGAVLGAGKRGDERQGGQEVLPPLWDRRERGAPGGRAGTTLVFICAILVIGGRERGKS